jgi:hypothetical protein
VDRKTSNKDRPDFFFLAPKTMYQGQTLLQQQQQQHPKKRVYMQLKVVIWWPWGSKGEVKSYLCRTNEGSLVLPYPTYLYDV